jgi:hypothetical protein
MEAIEADKERESSKDKAGKGLVPDRQETKGLERDFFADETYSAQV